MAQRFCSEEEGGKQPFSAAAITQADDAIADFGKLWALSPASIGVATIASSTMIREAQVVIWVSWTLSYAYCTYFNFGVSRHQVT